VLLKVEVDIKKLKNIIVKNVEVKVKTKHFLKAVLFLILSKGSVGPRPSISRRPIIILI